VESPVADSAPPDSAEFDLIVQHVTVTIESPPAGIAPPTKVADFEDITQPVTMTTVSSSFA
jgi:hypothetical protein